MAAHEEVAAATGEAAGPCELQGHFSSAGVRAEPGVADFELPPTDCLIFDQCAFAILIVRVLETECRACSGSRYRVQPGAFKVLQSAVEAALILRLRATWPWERPARQDWTRVDEDTCRRLCREAVAEAGLELGAADDLDTMRKDALVAHLEAL